VRSLRLLALALVPAAAIGGALAVAESGSGSAAGATAAGSGSDPVTLAVAAGRHVRIDGPRGAIHVWIPRGFRSETGATILYLHGYYDDADSAWTGHHLREQFAMSALDAMFIAPEAPSGSRQPVSYPNLSELLQIVEDSTGVPRGAALTAVVGHSGAFRTIDSWLDEPLVDQMVMIDAMYADDSEVEAWWRASPRHRLISVGEDTLQWNEGVMRDLPDPLIIDRFPLSYELWPEEAKTSRLVYIRAQFMHMPLVTDGIVMPALLRLLPVELLGDAPWRTPLGALPQPPGDGGLAGSGSG
jgi:hypothetical protein